MIRPVVCTKVDWDNDVIDVIIIYMGDELWIKGFDGFEWREANSFAEEVASDFGIKFTGDITTP